MKHVLTVLPITTFSELALFETAIRKATEGYTITRSMAYTNFRITAMRYQRTGSPRTFKNILSPQHFIETKDGTATLFRNIQDAGALDPEQGKYDSSDEHEEPRKRAKR